MKIYRLPTSLYLLKGNSLCSLEELQAWDEKARKTINSKTNFWFLIEKNEDDFFNIWTLINHEEIIIDVDPTYNVLNKYLNHQLSSPSDLPPSVLKTYTKLLLIL